MTTTLRDGTLFLLSSLNYRSKRESQKKKPVLSSHRPRTLGEEKESSTDPRKRRAADERCLLSSSSWEEKMKKPSSRFFFCLFLFSAGSKLNRKHALRRENQSIEKKTPALSLEIPLVSLSLSLKPRQEKETNVRYLRALFWLYQSVFLLLSSRVCCPPGPRAFRFRSLSLSLLKFL